MFGFVRRWLLVVVFSLSIGGHALAQNKGATPDDRAESFRAVSGGVKEDVAGGPLMLAAYAVVWLAVFGYVFRLVRLHRGVEASLSRLERAVGAGPEPREAGSR